MSTHGTPAATALLAALAAICAAAGAWSGAAVAQNPDIEVPPERDPLFVPPLEDVDADRDGTVSREEAAAHPPVSRIWDEADKDGDGVLTRLEYERFTSAQKG